MGSAALVWPVRIVILIVLAVAVGPRLYGFVCREVARWYHAAGFEYRLRDDLTSAVACLDGALTWNPHDLQLVIERADWKVRTGNAELAIPDCTLALAMARAQDAAKPSPESRFGLASALNTWAYVHALLGSRIPEALEHIQEAFRVLGHEHISAFLDTRGYLYLLAGKTSLALEDIENAVALAESEDKLARAQFRAQQELILDRRVCDLYERSLDERLAVIYHHRGEVYAELGEDRKARQDLSRAEKLGYDPSRGVW
jgi:tetratricopeptide (TPR) repeat protein